MVAHSGTTSDLKLLLIQHIAGLLDDLEMNDNNEQTYSDKAIVEMHERNIDLAGFVINSLGIADASKDEHGYTTRINPLEPHEYVDKHLK